MRYHLIDRGRKRRRTRPWAPLDKRRPAGQTGAVSERDLKRLAQAIIDRRGELRVTQEEFAARGNFSVKTVSRLEQASITPRATTLHSIDLAAGWQSGSARIVLYGGSPTTVTDMFARELRDEVEEAIWEMSLPEEQRWEEIFARRRRLAAENPDVTHTA